MDGICQFFSNWQSKDAVTAFIATHAALVATLNFAWPRLQEWRARRSAVFRALQGEREAIAEVGYRVTKSEWDSVMRHPTFRNKLTAALSMAFVLEGSDRAKAYVVAAFDHLVSCGYREDVLRALQEVQHVYRHYDAVVDDRDFREKRLKKLDSVIESLQPKAAPLNKGL